MSAGGEEDRWAEVERRVGYRFADRALLHAALTHRSHSYEREDVADNYERLEFLGDALLGFFVAEWLYRDDDASPEGVLSRRRQSVVRASVLAGIAEGLGLGAAMRLGVGEEATGGRSKRALLADLFEALLGAIYLDGGMDAARTFLARTLTPALLRVRGISRTIDDYKTRLQELLQDRLQRTPGYRIVSTSGPAHALEFEVEVMLDEHVLGSGIGANRKAAEQRAAREALEALRANPGLLAPERDA